MVWPALRPRNGCLRLYRTALKPDVRHDNGSTARFREGQAVAEIVDAQAASAAGLEMGALGLLVHSGSRGFGAAVLARHYHAGTEGLPLEHGGLAYLADHDRALIYARLNRQIIAERAMAALRTEGVLRLDVPHNLAESNAAIPSAPMKARTSGDAGKPCRLKWL